MDDVNNLKDVSIEDTILCEKCMKKATVASNIISVVIFLIIAVAITTNSSVKDFIKTLEIEQAFSSVIMIVIAIWAIINCIVLCISLASSNINKSACSAGKSKVIITAFIAILFSIGTYINLFHYS